MCQGLGFLYTQSGQYYMTLPHIDISDWQSWIYLTDSNPTNLHVHHHKIYDAHRLKENNLTNPYIHVEFPHWDNRLRLDWDYENYDEDRHWLNRSTYKHHVKQMQTIANHIITENQFNLDYLERILVISKIQIGQVYTMNTDYLQYALMNINNKYREIDKTSSEEEYTLSKEQYLQCVEQFKEDINIFTTVCCERMKLIVDYLIEAVNDLHHGFQSSLGNNYKVHRFELYYDAEKWTKYLIEKLIERKDMHIRSVFLPDEVPF